MIRAVTLDFDGTLVSRDILDVVCEIVGKGEESKRINDEFQAGLRAGTSPLLERIHFLKGVTISELNKKLDENLYLFDGAKELVAFLNDKGIVSILNSGNIMPVLERYQQALGISYVVGTRPRIEEGVIMGITQDELPPRDFKLEGVKKILGDLSVDSTQVVAIGDAPADRAIFEFAGASIAINPKGDIAQYADYIIHDLRDAIPIIEKLSEI